MCETAYEPGQENRTPSHGINSPVQHGQKPILSQGDNDRDKAEAEECYKQFRALDNDLAHNNYLIIPYLFDTGQYDEILRISLPRERLLIERQDTVNYYMSSVIKTLGYVCRDIGDYRKSSSYFERLALLRDSLKHREQESAAQDYATLYESKEKDLQLQKNNFSKEDMMKGMHIPVNRFSRLFTKYTGKSFSEYMQNLKLNLYMPHASCTTTPTGQWMP